MARRSRFASGRAGNLEIYVMNSNGSNPINLTNNLFTGFFPGLVA